MVGPGLGNDSIEAGKKATLVAGALVIIFMFATYGVFASSPTSRSSSMWASSSA